MAENEIEVILEPEAVLVIQLEPQGSDGPEGPPGPPGEEATLPAEATQEEAEAGIETATRMWSPLRIFQAIASWVTTWAASTLGSAAYAETTDFISADAIQASLLLYPTTADSAIPGYKRMVRLISDPDYDTVAVDVSTGVITTTDQLISSLAADAGLFIGDPGVVKFTVSGNIRRTDGSGTATFHFSVFHRTAAGVETLLGMSTQTAVVNNAAYTGFSADVVVNDGEFTTTDHLVYKFYADRMSGGSDPTFDFQFGGLTPVVAYVPVPVSVLPHNNLARIQGGTTDERYHLTEEERAIALAGGAGYISGSHAELYIAEGSIATADSVTVTDGTITSGSYTDTHTINQIYLTVQETGKFKVDFPFTIASDPAQFRFIGRYQGNPAHEVEVKALNKITSLWDDLKATVKDIPHNTSDTEIMINFPADSSMYNDAGVVTIRLEHVSNFTNTHYLYIDYVEVVGKTITLPNAGTFYPLTGLTAGESSDVTVDASAGTMTIITDGLYSIVCSASWGGTPNTLFHGHIFVNGIEQEKIGIKRHTDSAGEVDETGCSGSLNLVTGDVLSFRITSESSGAFGFVEYFNLSIKKYMGALVPLADYVPIQSGHIAGQFGLQQNVYTPVDGETVNLDYTLCNAFYLDCSALATGDEITINVYKQPLPFDANYTSEPLTKMTIKTGADPLFTINWQAGIVAPTLVASKQNQFIAHQIENTFGAYWHLSAGNDYDITPGATAIKWDNTFCPDVTYSNGDRTAIYAGAPGARDFKADVPLSNIDTYLEFTINTNPRSGWVGLIPAAYTYLFGKQGWDVGHFAYAINYLTRKITYNGAEIGVVGAGSSNIYGLYRRQYDGALFVHLGGVWVNSSTGLFADATPVTTGVPDGMYPFGELINPVSITINSGQAAFTYPPSGWYVSS